MKKKVWMILSAVSSVAMIGAIFGIFMTKKGGCSCCKGGCCGGSCN